MANNITRATELESLLERAKFDSVDEFEKVLASTYDYLITKLAKLPDDPRRLQSMLKDVVERIKADYPKLYELVQDDMNEWAKMAYDSQAGALAGTLPEGVVVASTFSSLSEAATKRVLDPNMLIQGQTLDTWVNDLGDQKARQIRSIIAEGVASGQANTEISRRIRENIESIPRRHVEPLIRTAIGTATQNANNEAYKQLEKYTDVAIYQAVLDTRTTPYCSQMNGTTWHQKPGESPSEFRERVLKPKHGRSPMTPTHWGCRSRLVFTTEGFYDDWKDKQKKVIVRDTSDDRANVTKHRDGTTSRKFKIKDIDKVDVRNKDFDFATWFDNEATAEYKRFYLGETKWKLYEQGNLSYNDVANLRQNKILTIKEIKAKL